jgi:hypothetical protein
MSKAVKIVGEHHRVCLENLPPDLERRLQYPEWQLAPAKYGPRAVHRRRKILREGPGTFPLEQALVGARGLEPVILRLAIRKGLPCIHRTEPPAELPDPDLGAVLASGAVDVAILCAVRQHYRFLVKYRPGVDPAKLIVQVALAYPGAVMTIAVQHKKQARHIARLLRAAEISASAITNQDHVSADARVVVATFGQLGRAAARLHRLDLLIVLDGVAALGEGPRQFLTPSYTPVYFRVPRIVGLVPADRHLALADQVGLVELFGPVTMTIQAHGMVERPVEVVPVYFKGGQASWDRRALTCKRRNVWHHRLRNRLVAGAARALVAGDRAALAAYVRGLEKVPNFPLPARVTVVVENMEHAEALKAELPGWPVDEPAAGWVTHEIATFDWLRSRRLDDVDVIVRADGGTGLLPMAPLALASPSLAPTLPLVVVDILDRNHPELRKAVRSREHAYVEAGWRPAGCDAIDFVLFTLFPERARR